MWAVNVAGGKATQEGTLAKGPWVFTNGFNHNTGEPYMESIDSDETNPAGNGPADTSPVTRDGGTVLANDVRGPDQAAGQPVPARRRLHRRRRRDVGVLRRQADADDLLPAQGRRGVDGVRQAEHAPWHPRPPAFPLVLPPAA